MCAKVDKDATSFLRFGMNLIWCPKFITRYLNFLNLQIFLVSVFKKNN